MTCFNDTQIIERIIFAEPEYSQTAREKEILKLTIPRGLPCGDPIKGKVRETAGFSVDYAFFISCQLALEY